MKIIDKIFEESKNDNQNTYIYIYIYIKSFSRQMMIMSFFIKSRIVWLKLFSSLKYLTSRWEYKKDWYFILFTYIYIYIYILYISSYIKDISRMIYLPAWIFWYRDLSHYVTRPLNVFLVWEIDFRIFFRKTEWETKNWYPSSNYKNRSNLNCEYPISIF